MENISANRTAVTASSGFYFEKKIHSGAVVAVDAAWRRFLDEVGMRLRSTDTDVGMHALT